MLTSARWHQREIIVRQTLSLSVPLIVDMSINISWWYEEEEEKEEILSNFLLHDDDERQTESDEII